MIDTSTPDFARFYADRLTREAAARPGPAADWLREAAIRAVQRASQPPVQGELFG